MRILIILALLVSCSTATSQEFRKGYIDVVKDCQVKANGTDTTIKLAECLQSVQPESVVYFKPGVYSVSSPLPAIVGNHITLLADSYGVARIKFTGCGDLLTFTNQPKVNFNSGISKLWLHSTRTDCDTRALVVNDASQFTVNNIYIMKFDVGINTYGREFLRIKDSKIEAGQPIVISKNPNHSYIDSDHTQITNLHSIVTDPEKYHINVDDGVTLLNFTVDGAAMPRGAGIIHWESITPATNVSYHVKLANIRHEQNTGDNPIYIDVAKPLHGLVVDNVRFEGRYQPNSTAIYLNNVLGVSIRDTSYPNNSESTFLYAENADFIELNNNFYYPLSIVETDLQWVNGPFRTRNQQRTSGILSNGK